MFFGSESYDSCKNINMRLHAVSEDVSAVCSAVGGGDSDCAVFPVLRGVTPLLSQFYLT